MCPISDASEMRGRTTHLRCVANRNQTLLVILVLVLVLLLLVFVLVLWILQILLPLLVVERLVAVLVAGGRHWAGAGAAGRILVHRPIRLHVPLVVALARRRHRAVSRVGLWPRRVTASGRRVGRVSFVARRGPLCVARVAVRVRLGVVAWVADRRRARRVLRTAKRRRVA